MEMLLDTVGMVCSLFADITNLMTIFLADFDPLNMEIYDVEDLTKLALRFLLNFGFVIVLVRYIYYPIAKRKDFLFTYVLISITVFLLCFLLENVKIDLAFALGLFAIFGIIRYRTDPIPIKEMTYLFIVIGMSVLNALINKKISLAEMVLANLIVIVITYGFERIWLTRHESFKVVLYEKIELIKPERYNELIDDLQGRTGLKITRIEIGKIDFLRDTAQLRVFFFEDDQDGYLVQNMSGEDMNMNESEDFDSDAKDTQ